MKKIRTDQILLDPNPVLREKAKPVRLPLSKQNRDILEGLLDYVRRSHVPELVEKENLKPASGLAAPQLGILKRMLAVVIDFVHEDDSVETLEFALANPKVISYSVKEAAIKAGEGCLSVEDPHPGLVYRPQRVKIQAYDLLQDKMITITASGYLAIVLQHEIDHLNGILFYDHIDVNMPWAIKENALIIE